MPRIVFCSEEPMRDVIAQVDARVASLARIAFRSDLELSQRDPNAGASRYRGFPLVVGESGVPLEPSIPFLAKRQTVDGRDRYKTLKTYAEHLLSWMQFLESRGIPWEQATAEHLSRYAEQPRLDNDGPLRLSTTRARTRLISDFYLSVEETGSLSGAYSWKAGLASYRSSSDRSPEIVSPTRRTTPKGYAIDAVRRLLANAPVPFSLMFEWMLKTGIRPHELCAMTLTELDKIRAAVELGSYLVSVTIVRKGSVERDIRIPFGLIDKTATYATEIRPAHVKKGAREVRTGSNAALFVSRRGSPVTAAYLSKVFRSLRDEFGLNGNLYRLRHTYANELRRILKGLAKQHPDFREEKVLQLSMGHQHFETTQIYLDSFVDANEQLALQLLEKLFAPLAEICPKNHPPHRSKDVAS